MMRFIDTSNHQGGIDVTALQGIDAVICKATEGDYFVDAYCDSTVQRCIENGIPWGFYHFAGDDDPINEADWFVNNCINYFNHGIPVLDWEGVHDENGKLIFEQSVDWVNAFVNRVHERTGVMAWIYANPWRFNQGGVEPNCARWIASYPDVAHPAFGQAETWDCPSADGNVVAWQFCSDGIVDGFNGNLDCSLFYGTKEQWLKYANPNASGGGNDGSGSGDCSVGDAAVLENDEYKITIEKKE